MGAEHHQLPAHPSLNPPSPLKHAQEGVLSSRTTNYQRTLATLRGVLSGLYPDAQRPMPVTTSSDVDEILWVHEIPHVCMTAQGGQLNVWE